MVSHVSGTASSRVVLAGAFYVYTQYLEFGGPLYLPGQLALPSNGETLPE